MMKRGLKILAAIIATSAVIFGFQNCGESLDLSDQLGLASNAKGVSFLATNEIGDENQPYQLAVLVNNIDNYTVAWEKDGVPIEGATTETLDFASLEFADEANYEAVVTSTEGEYRSGLKAIRVRQDPTESLTPAPVQFGRIIVNINNVPSFIYLRTNGLAVATRNAMAASFCRAQYGPKANYITYDHTGANFGTYNRYMTYSATPYTSTTCNPASAFIIGQFGDNLCMRQSASNLNIAYFNSVSCTRYENYVEPQ